MTPCLCNVKSVIIKKKKRHCEGEIMSGYNQELSNGLRDRGGKERGGSREKDVFVGCLENWMNFLRKHPVCSKCGPRLTECIWPTALELQKCRKGNSKKKYILLSNM